MNPGTLAQLFPILMPIAMQAIPQVISSVSQPSKPKQEPVPNRPMQDPRDRYLPTLYDDLYDSRLR